MKISPIFGLFALGASAGYTITDHYAPNDFASQFEFFTGDDPTGGYVNYVSLEQAQASKMLQVKNDQVYIGVDNTKIATGRGRDSIRITSKRVYNHGLFLLDLSHMPASACGTWPAFWLLGPDWPNGGEIDIIEGVNTQRGNSFAVHTNSGCSIQNAGNFAGILKTSNCDTYATNQPGNAGCAIQSTNDQSYGTPFNDIGGGVYATEWTSEAITVWFFPRSAIPADITSGAPNPNNWGLPSAQFRGDCDMDQHVVDQRIVFDVTFCGQWAGSAWSADATCRTKSATCEDFVKNEPAEFRETYWKIYSLDVYQNEGAAPSPSPSESSKVRFTTKTTSSSTVVTGTTTTTLQTARTTLQSTTTTLQSTTTTLQSTTTTLQSTTTTLQSTTTTLRSTTTTLQTTTTTSQSTTTTSQSTTTTSQSTTTTSQSTTTTTTVPVSPPRSTMATSIVTLTTSSRDVAASSDACSCTSTDRSDQQNQFCGRPVEDGRGGPSGWNNVRGPYGQSSPLPRW